jgi:hypothetical protein
VEPRTLTVAQTSALENSELEAQSKPVGGTPEVTQKC